MKLTTEQLDLIDRYLEQRNLIFLDFKIEVKDHIAFQIEKKMEENENDFEVNFNEVIRSWEHNLSPKYLLHTKDVKFPNLVVQQLKKKATAYSVLTLLTTTVLTIFAKIYFIQYLDKNFKYLQCLVVFICFSYLFFRRNIVLQKLPTSFSYKIDCFFMPVLVTLFYFFIFNKNGFETFGIFLGFTIFLEFPFMIYFYYKHRNFIKKYNLA
jgi:hypothetical protein